METLIIICIIIATFIIIWFIRGVREQNSKILKEIEEGQKEVVKLLSNNAGKIEEGYKLIAEMLYRESK